MTRRLFQISSFTLLFSIFASQVLFLAKTNSAVSDEVAHIGAGYSYWKYNDFRLNPEHPLLVKQIAAIPLIFMDLQFPAGSQAWNEAEQWSLGRAFLYTLGNPGDTLLFRARAALLPLALAMALLIFFWTRDLFGTGAAFFALFLFSFFPEMIAHASLVTTDFAPALFYCAVFYFLYRFLQTQKMRDFYLAGIAAGLALVSKYSMLSILPLLYAFVICHSRRILGGNPAIDPRQKISGMTIPLWLMALITVFVVSHKKSFLIVCVPFVYLWLTFLLPRVSWLRHPGRKQAAERILILIAVAFLVVLAVYFEPAFWHRGGIRMDPFKRFFRGWAIFRDHSTGGTHPSFLLGTFSSKGWWYYYLVAMLVKIPVPILISFFLGLIQVLKLLRPAPERPRNYALLLFILPPLYYWGLASFINKVNIGVRHILIVYPFLIITAGAAWQTLRRIPVPAFRPAAAALLGGWLIFSAGSAFPHYLSYLNETAVLLGGKENVLSDSNISWGQDLKRLKRWMDLNNVTKIYRMLNFNMPEELRYYQIEEEPEPFVHFRKKDPGYYAVDYFTYQGLLQDPQTEWIKKEKPAAQIGGSILVYKF